MPHPLISRRVLPPHSHTKTCPGQRAAADDIFYQFCSAPLPRTSNEEISQFLEQQVTAAHCCWWHLALMRSLQIFLYFTNIFMWNNGAECSQCADQFQRSVEFKSPENHDKTKMIMMWLMWGRCCQNPRGQFSCQPQLFFSEHLHNVLNFIPNTQHTKQCFLWNYKMLFYT